jgi:hypothetical protein
MTSFILFILLVAVVAYFTTKKAPQKKRPEIKITIERSSNFNFEEEEGSDTDSWEGGFWEASDPKKLAARLQIEYTDGNGRLSKRIVRVREFDNGLYGGVIIGHCELRNATRTFRFDRIKSCVDLETGEFIENVKSHLNKLFNESPERSTDLLLNDYIDLLKVFYFIAKADGQFTQKEKEVILGYIKKLVRDDRVTIKMVDDVFSKIQVPSLQGYKLAIGRVLKGGYVDHLLLENSCNEIIATQQVVHPNEKEALDYLTRKRLSIIKENA